MMPHYLDHNKSKAGKYLNSKRDNRYANPNRGKGRKAFRPKGGAKMNGMLGDSPELSDISFYFSMTLLGFLDGR